VLARIRILLWQDGAGEFLDFCCASFPFLLIAFVFVFWICVMQKITLTTQQRYWNGPSPSTKHYGELVGSWNAWGAKGTSQGMNVPFQPSAYGKGGFGSMGPYKEEVIPWVEVAKFV
jgi:hypothetical protein